MGDYFGNRYFGLRHYGARYFGAGDGSVPPEPGDPIRRNNPAIKAMGLMMNRR